MQLEEQEKLDFDTDINTYLGDIQVPEAFGKPITITHLMSHTPGFEDLPLDLFKREASSMRPLQEVLQSEMPARVRAPGELTSYSNHGVGMAGLIVENVSGESWQSYIENHILTPLAAQFLTFL